MAPFVDRGPRKPFAYLCIVQFSGVQVDGTKVEEKFIKMTAARSDKDVEKQVLEALARDPREGFRSQSYNVTHVQNVHPRELDKLLEKTRDDNDSGGFGTDEYFCKKQPVEALVV